MMFANLEVRHRINGLQCCLFLKFKILFIMQYFLLLANYIFRRPRQREGEGEAPSEEQKLAPTDGE
jgi:hypothetical protein